MFVQPLASDGSLAGEAWEPTLLPELGHGVPTVAPAEDGAYVAFEREEEFATRVWLARHGSDADAELALESPAITSSPHLVADRADPLTVYLAVTGEVIAGSPDVFLAVASEPLATRTRLQLGASGRLDYGPRIVPHPDGGGVVFYVRTEGAESRILAQRFSLAAGELVAGAEVEVAPSIAPYPLTAAHVAGDVFFAAWSERSTGELRLAGRFVEIPR